MFLTIISNTNMFLMQSACAGKTWRWRWPETSSRAPGDEGRRRRAPGDEGRRRWAPEVEGDHAAAGDEGGGRRWPLTDEGGRRDGGGGAMEVTRKLGSTSLYSLVWIAFAREDEGVEIYTK